MKQRIHQMELFMKYPHDVQAEWFKKLMEAGRDTEWGQRYDYKSIASVEDFKNRVPASNYDDIRDDIERVRQGEQNILWPTDIKWFAKSSGTTGDKSKFIPVSAESLAECHFKGGKDMLSIYCNNYPETNIFSGKGLTLGGTHQMGEFENSTYYGDLSAILMENLPFWVHIIRTPDLSIALMDEWESKIDAITKATVNEDVTNLAGVPSWTLVLLKYVLETTGKSNINEVWPNLEVFFHGGINFAPYREQFKKLIPSTNMHYLETYNASEGFFGIQDTSDKNELLLMLDYGVYYEFMPMEEVTSNNPKTLQLGEVQLNTNYALIISTNAGLWRYKIGDTIMFTSLNPYRIKITGRTKSFINAFGEELMVDNADKALDIACKKTGAILREYTAAPVFMGDHGSGAHEWLIEFEKHPENPEYFGECLDNALKAVNSDYEAKRYKDMALKDPIVRVMPEGTFYNWLKFKGKLGGQHKVPRLNNDRKMLEEVLALVKN
jgi:hypothetical protein